MENICDISKCLGCFACKSICPKDAISVAEDKLARTIPKVDNVKCIDCGLCSKICPVNNEKNWKDSKRCYAAYTKNDKDRNECASGGIASTFARKIFEEEGLIVGSVFENGILKQKLLSKNDNWEKIKGSKYVQSYTGKSYHDTKDALKNGKKVLYIGTPCQIDGLYSFLRNDYENLITVDLICHGTPPAKYLDEYCKSVSNNHSYTDVTFRGARDWDLSIYNKDVLLYAQNCNIDLYFTAFLEGLSYRENCYKCPYAQPKRVSDITIGDFWGIDWSTLRIPKPKKMSVILAQTEKGIRFIETLKDYLYVEERSINEAVEGNAQLRRPSVCHIDRELFVRNYPEKGFVESAKTPSVVKKIRKKKFKNTVIYRGARKCKRIIKKVLKK